MVEDLVAPGVTRQRSEYDGEELYFGEPAALRRAGLIAQDCTLPGEQPGKRGVRWVDATGRRWVLSKSAGPERVCLKRCSTKAEKEGARRAAESASRTKQRLESLDSALSSWGDSQSQFKYCLSRCVGDVLKEVDRYAWADSPCRGPWTLATSARARIDALRRMFLIARTDLEMEHDPEWRLRLEAERAMLRDAPEGESKCAAEAQLAGLLGRIARA